jgi:predicted ArsR family transcriptional regulator
MSTIDRMEIIAEIETAAESLGMENMTVLSRLDDLEDNDLVRLQFALNELVEISED